MSTTCQICARPIKANKGYIAHHGYRRPGGGWQTSSCRGAKHLPYEQSCDLIPVVIKEIEAWIANAREALAKHVAEPPATMFWVKRRDAWDKRGTLVEVAKPADFDPSNQHDYELYKHNSYRYLWDASKHHQERGIRESEVTIEDLRERLARWKAP